MEGPERRISDMPEAENRITRYLLGELSPAEMLQLENDYFRDEELFESVQALEDQLLRDFVRDEMDNDRRRRFEARYRGSPELAKKIEFAQAVLSGLNLLAEQRSGATAPAGPSRRLSIRDLFNFRVSVFQYATVGLALLGIGVGYVEWTRSARLELALANVQQEKNSLAQQKSALDRALSERPKEPPLVASFILMPGISRDQGGGNVLLVPSGLGEVRLKLPLPQAIKYAGYRIVLQRSPSGQVSSQDYPPDAVVDSGKAIVFSVPSVSLRAGQYILFVKGRSVRGDYEDVQYYPFEVKP